MGQQRLPAWLARQLRRREWSQADFARRLGVSSGRVSEWLTGKRVPSPRSCDLIADALGIDLDAVLALAGHRPTAEPVKADDPRGELLAKLTRVRLDRTRELGLRAILDAWLAADRGEPRGTGADGGERRTG